MSYGADTRSLGVFRQAWEAEGEVLGCNGPRRAPRLQARNLHPWQRPLLRPAHPPTSCGTTPSLPGAGLFPSLGPPVAWASPLPFQATAQGVWSRPGHCSASFPLSGALLTSAAGAGAPSAVLARAEDGGMPASTPGPPGKQHTRLPASPSLIHWSQVTQPGGSKSQASRANCLPQPETLGKESMSLPTCLLG